MLGITQVYYCKILYKTHQQNRYLQWILKQKVFIKVIKNAKLEAWVERPRGLLKKVEHECLKWGLQSLLD